MSSVPLKLYPRAHQNRIHGADKSVQSTRRTFLKAASINFMMLQILFLGLFAYIFGSLYQQGGHAHNLNVAFVDYDGGIIGQSVRDAYTTLQGSSFPTLQEQTAGDYTTPQDLREAICKARYWAAMYVSPGASSRLEGALNGGSAAATYNRSDVLTFIWNEARYSAIIDTTISANLQILATAARLAYVARNGTAALQTVPTTDSAAVSVFSNPWQLANINIQATTQGSRLIYNTLVIILILIQEFFYLGTINGLYAQFKMYEKFYPHRIIAYRNTISLAYTFVGSLCTAGAIWAFRAGWNVNSNQFALTWASLWLFAHINFLTLDIFTVWLPAPLVPMALIAWVVFNVTSILLPFELSPKFYWWAYAMPAHEVYQTLIDIWSSGCNPQLRYTLPILFSLEITGLVLSALGVYRRCHYAVIAAEGQEAAFRSRLDAAMAFERKRDQEKQRQPSVSPMPGQDGDAGAESERERAEEATDREELGEVIRKEDSDIRREQSRASRAANFGPCFDLPFRE